MVFEILANIALTVGAGMFAILFWTSLVAWSRECWQQRRFDRWHRRRLARRLRAWASRGPHGPDRRHADAVHDVSRQARDLRSSAGPRAYPVGLVWFFPVMIPWLLWRWARARAAGTSTPAALAPNRRDRYRTRGPGTTTAWLFRMLSALLFVLAVVMFASPRPANGPTSDNPAGPAVVGAFFLAGSALALRSARRCTALSAPEAMAADSRPMVLYLRSFGDDRLRMRAHRSGRHSFVERIGPGRRDFVEEIFVDKLWRYGPVVAVGQPQETQPPIGAAREQLSERQWRNTVERRMSKAALIVVMLGRTAGLAWEIETLVRLRLWHKVLLVFPPVGVRELESRWSTTQQILQDQGVSSMDLRAEPGEVLAVRSEFGEIVSFTCDRRDEWGYVAALEAAAGTGPRTNSL